MCNGRRMSKSGHIVRGFILSLVIAVVPTWAAPLDYYLGADETYDQRVPTPEAFFGFEVGEWHLRPDQIENYLRAVAEAAPDRARLEVFGHTHELRALMQLIVASPERLADLETARKQHLASIVAKKLLREDLAKMPAVVNLGYSIHGNEPSGANAAVLAAYWLVASESAAAQQARRELVVLVDPMFNPDGIARFAHWANTHRGVNLVADNYHREHREPWPSGRTNHYWFDLNRDWFPLVHPESQARVKRFHEWKPNIMNDHHEMGTDKTYFFQPGAPLRNNPSTPARVFEMQARLAEFHAEALDKKGSFYYTAEGYDDFYPGKGSVYPDLNGGMGILYEQASSRGGVQATDFGDLTFAFTIRNQVITSLSTILGAVAMRTDLLEYQREFFRSASEFAEESGVGGWVFDPTGDPAKAWELRSMLAHHQIEVRTLKRDVTYEDRLFEAGEAWVVPAAQAQSRLVAELFTDRTEFESEAFYDISAWSVARAFNLPFAKLSQQAWGGRNGLAGDVVPLGSRPTGRVIGQRSHVVAYVVPAKGADVPRVLGRLGRAGVGAQVMTKAIGIAPAGSTEMMTFEAGSVVIPVGRQWERAALIEAVVDDIIAHDAVEIVALAGGLTPVGNDMGSPSWITTTKGRVAVLIAGGLSAYDAGEIWHTLDTRWNLPVVLLEVADVTRADLSGYDAIIVVDGTYSSLSDDAAASLKSWTQAGGSLIVFNRAAKWAAEKLGVKIELVDDLKSGAKAKGHEKAVAEVIERQPFGDSDDIERAKRIPGSIFVAEADLTHPLNYGLDEPLVPVFRRGTLAMKPSKSPYNTPLIYAENPLLAGYAPADQVQRIANQAAALVEPLGKGRVVAMSDNPVFRGYWFGGMRLLSNAIFFGPAMKPTSISEAEGDSHD
jgi:hypothetical protein